MAFQEPRHLCATQGAAVVVDQVLWASCVHPRAFAIANFEKGC